MHERGISAVILAAGEGTRMGGDTPKPLLDLDGKPIVEWVVLTLKESNIDDITIVVSANDSKVRQFVEERGLGRVVNQVPERGTAKGTESGIVGIESKTVIVLFGDDSGLYTTKTINDFLNFHIQSQSKITMMVSKLSDPTQLGGLEVDQKGLIKGILTKAQLEERGAMESFVACGVFCFDLSWLKDKLSLVPPSMVSGEYTLPSLIDIANSENTPVYSYVLADINQWNSVNTPEELEAARYKKRKQLAKNDTDK
jgi:bifunctional UDP-N-acetylglucosamine pyrophosphorylase/glucosamine-1-phosphate N-acetyltransferase